MYSQQHRLIVWLFVAALTLLPLQSPARATAKKNAGFGDMVRLMERHYKVRHRGIPTLANLGIKAARTTAKIVSPTARKYLRTVGDFKLALFEDQDFSAGAGTFYRGVRETMEPGGWHPLVVVLTSDDAQVFTYTKATGEKYKVLVVVIEQRDAVAVEVELYPREFFQLLRDPEGESRSLADEAATAEP
ncbi:MAG: hypothetical protein ACRD9R_22580 [Pyrinomonadaceae bacterium]